MATVNWSARGNVTYHVRTADWTLALPDGSSVVMVMNKATAVNLIVPPDADVAFAIGVNIGIWNKGAGAVTVVEGAGVTVHPPATGTLVSAGQGARLNLEHVGVNEWQLSGETTDAG